jgi:polyhydroxyalkanoate synthesis regulator phasin
MTEKDPFELWKKAFLIGLGATAVTMEKVQELANELVERGELTQKDARGFSEDLKNRALKEKELFETKIKESVDGYMKAAVRNFGLVTREEWEELKAQVDSQKSSKTKATSAKD